MREAIEEAGRVVTHDLERFLTTLGTIAAMAPLLGLFGTVIGMIEIFGSQTAAGVESAAARARHLGRALQHGARPDRRDPQHDFLPPLPRRRSTACIVEMEQQAIKLVDFAHGERK